MIFTDKQAELLRTFKCGQLKRINILHGSVRSGKTWISLVLWAFWVLSMPQEKAYLMVAKTLTSLRRNCLDLLEELVGKEYFTYSLSRKEASLFGRKIYLEGVNDARAENKIRGMTLQGAYCDELTLFTEDFFSMLLSRLSEPHAKLFGTTNPDNPKHWLKENYIDRSGKLNMFVMQFLIDDNTTLEPEYVRNLKSEHTGVFYRRFILGEWCNAEGVVYPMFDEMRHVVDEIPECCGFGQYYISIDYGTMNPCSMGLWRLDNERAVRLKEVYYDGRKKQKQLTDEEYYGLLDNLASEYPVEQIIVDPSAASFIETIRRHGKYSVRKANNDVLDGIRVTGTLLQNGKIFIHRSCRDIIKEFSAYSWDEKSSEDKVIKEHDHAMDDMRYFCNTIVRRRLGTIEGNTSKGA